MSFNPFQPPDPWSTRPKDDSLTPIYDKMNQGDLNPNVIDSIQSGNFFDKFNNQAGFGVTGQYLKDPLVQEMFQRQFAPINTNAGGGLFPAGGDFKNKDWLHGGDKGPMDMAAKGGQQDQIGSVLSSVLGQAGAPISQPPSYQPPPDYTPPQHGVPPSYTHPPVTQFMGPPVTPPGPMNQPPTTKPPEYLGPPQHQ